MFFFWQTSTIRRSCRHLPTCMPSSFSGERGLSQTFAAAHTPMYLGNTPAPAAWKLNHSIHPGEPQQTLTKYHDRSFVAISILLESPTKGCVPQKSQNQSQQSRRRKSPGISPRDRLAYTYLRPANMTVNQAFLYYICQSYDWIFNNTKQSTANSQQGPHLPPAPSVHRETSICKKNAVGLALRRELLR